MASSSSSSAAASLIAHSNLQHFLQCVTPTVPSRTLPQVWYIGILFSIAPSPFFFFVEIIASRLFNVYCYLFDFISFTELFACFFIESLNNMQEVNFRYLLDFSSSSFFVLLFKFNEYLNFFFFLDE